MSVEGAAEYALGSRHGTHGPGPRAGGEPAWADPARLAATAGPRHEAAANHRSPSPLTPREHEIVLLIAARGLSNREIADELVISPATAARQPPR